MDNYFTPMHSEWNIHATFVICVVETKLRIIFIESLCRINVIRYKNLVF